MAATMPDHGSVAPPGNTELARICEKSSKNSASRPPHRTGKSDPRPAPKGARNMRKAILPAVAFTPLLTALVCAPQAAADSTSFLSPSRNISCEMRTDYTYCQTNSPPQSVHMSANGTVAICNTGGCVGNPGIGTPTLAYGQSASAGPFTCVSAPGGVTCTVASGHGFTISNSGIQQQ
jgi:hypothetical protein